ncbi:MAG: secreted trypsin-like serine protease [Myxococcota bacterium]|jgi:secreted trypsin-like serine protease
MLIILTLTASAQQVVGGTQVAAGDFQDTAGIVFGNSVDCTGVLVAPNVVLTAGHCAGGITAVVLATNDYQQSGEVIRVTETIEYNNSWSSYDVSVLILEEDAQTEPAMIAQDCILDDYLYDGAKVTIVGYGATDNNGNQYSSRLNEADTTIDDDDCTIMQSGCNNSVSPGGELGAGADDEFDSCYGDSGGPLYLSTPEGHFLIGLTSRGYSNSNLPCGQGGIYVRPDAIIDWIEQVSGADIPAPDCTVNTEPQPTAEAITTPTNKTGRTVVDPGDPDPDDTHTFTIIEEPQSGAVTIDGDGIVAYEPETDFVGSDSFVVAVTDSRSATGEVTVDVTVAGEGEGGDGSDGVAIEGCGCASSVTPRGVSLIVMLVGLLGLRRRS